MNPTKFIAFAGVALLAAFGARAAVSVGQLAPNFTLTGIDGKPYSLSDYKGKIVVLEWVNPECPFVGKHYKSGNMQALQKAATSAGVVWLSINSASPGKQGDYDTERAAAWLKKVDAAPTAYLRDPDGMVGHLYGAKTTPDMYIINADGTLVYEGAIDSIRSAKTDDVAKANNYVKAALTAVQAGQPVLVAISEPYGCSVKY